MAYELFPYQQLASQLIKEKFQQGIKRVCLCLPTGGGKTIIFSDIANKAIAKGKRVLICVHRNELAEQAKRTTAATVIMVETLNNRLQDGSININDFDLFIVDEVHIGNFRKVLTNFSGYVIGATATPVTINKDYPLKSILQDIVCPVTIEQLIAINRLAVPKTFARLPEKYSELKKSSGEFSEKSQNIVFDNRKVFEGLLEDYRNHLQGAKGIVFCCSIKHSISVYESFIAEGVNAFLVHSKMKDRKIPLEKYLRSSDGVMINCGILTTGFDCPDIDFVMINRVTTSLALWLQMIGRGSRVIEGLKHSFRIYDYGMNIKTLGFWQEPRNWNKIFFADPKSKGEGVAPVKACPKCTAVLVAASKECEYCGHVFEDLVKAIAKTNLEEMVYNHTLNRKLYDLTPDELFIVAARKNYKAQFIERVIYFAHGKNELTKYWDQKQYKQGYRNRRLELFSTEQPVNNFIVK